METRVYRIPQIDESVRLFALNEDDYEAVRNNPPMIDAVRPLAIADVHRGGEVDWVSRRSSRGVAAIEDEMEAIEEEAADA